MNFIARVFELAEYLKGKKTYIVAFITATLNLLVAFNVITVDQLTNINIVLGAVGLASLRAGVAKK